MRVIPVNPIYASRAHILTHRARQHNAHRNKYPDKYTYCSVKLQRKNLNKESLGLSSRCRIMGWLTAYFKETYHD